MNFFGKTPVEVVTVAFSTFFLDFYFYNGKLHSIPSQSRRRTKRRRRRTTRGRSARTLNAPSRTFSPPGPGSSQSAFVLRRAVSRAPIRTASSFTNILQLSVKLFLLLPDHASPVRLDTSVLSLWPFPWAWLSFAFRFLVSRLIPQLVPLQFPASNFPAKTVHHNTSVLPSCACERLWLFSIVWCQISQVIPSVQKRLYHSVIGATFPLPVSTVAITSMFLTPLWPRDSGVLQRS